MTRLRDRLAVVFGGLMICVMVAIILSEEKLLSRLLENLETNRFSAAAGQFIARLETILESHAGRLEDLDRAGDLETLARISNTSVAAEALMLAERLQAERLVLADPRGRIIAANPNDWTARLLASAAPIKGQARKALVLLPEGLTMLNARTFIEGGRPSLVLVVGDVVDADLLRRAAGAEDDAIFLVASGRILEAYAPRESGSQGAKALSAEFTPHLSQAPEDGRPWPVRLGDEDFVLVGHKLVNPASGRPVARLWFGRRAGEVYAPVDGQRRRLSAMALAGVLGALAAAFALSGRITLRLEVLARRMSRVPEGDLENVEVQGRDEIAQLASSFNEMTSGLRQKNLLRRYVPVHARNLIDADTDGSVVMGGKRTRISVLFSDLRGFTALSEQLDPAEVVTLLNEYLGAMIQVLHAHDGDVSDYFGDAILAVFHDGETTSALQAVRAALRMQEALEDLRARTPNPYLKDLRMGIGIHTGEAVEGNIGTAERLKYAVVGDTVNVGARVQDRSRDGQHTCVLISEATHREVGDRVESVFFGDEILKGKSAPVAIWEVVRLAEDPTPPCEAAVAPEA